MVSHSFGIKLYACQVSGGEMFPLGHSSDDTASGLTPVRDRLGWVTHQQLEASGSAGDGQRLMITVDFFFSLQK